MLRVMYRNERYDMIKAERLDVMIALGEIKKFYGPGEWIDVETAPLRGSGGLLFIELIFKVR